MTSRVLAGFSDELVKVSGPAPLRYLADLAAGIKKNPAMRRAIMRGAAVGAAGGALSNVPTGSGKTRERMLRGGIGGALSGAAVGALAPGWFHPSSMKLPHPH